MFCGIFPKFLFLSFLQVSALLLDAPLDSDLNPVDEEMSTLKGILSDLGCQDSFSDPVSQPLATLLGDVRDGISGVPLFRLGHTSCTQWVRRVADSSRLMAFIVTSYQGDRLQWTPDVCRLCLGRRHDILDCDFLSSVSRQRRQLTGICWYPYCKSTGSHSTYFCDHLNGRCSVCHFRDLSTDGVCDKLVANHEVFNEWSPHCLLYTSPSPRDRG